MSLRLPGEVALAFAAGAAACGIVVTLGVLLAMTGFAPFRQGICGRCFISVLVLPPDAGANGVASQHLVREIRSPAVGRQIGLRAVSFVSGTYCLISVLPHVS